MTYRHGPDEGTDRLTDPARALLEFRRKYNDLFDRNAFATASWEYTGGDNRGAHLNFRIADARVQLDQTNAVFPTGGTNRDDRLSQGYGARTYELGGDVTRPLLGGGIKLIGLVTRRHRDSEDTSLNIIQGTTIGGFIQRLVDQRDETLLRLVWSRADLEGWSVEAGIEGALNHLESNVDLFSIGAGGALTRIDLPVDQAVVQEYRGEAFINAGRLLSSRLRMDLGLVFETSRLTVRGDAEAERSLSFLKPRAAFDWPPPGGWHAQQSIARTVAQLNFEDFISGAELTNNRVNGGNPDLVPQRAWEVLATIERPIHGDGVAKVEMGHNRISLLQDRIPTSEGFDAPGNLGTGRQTFVRGTLDAPLGRLGIRGSRLTVNGTLQSTSVVDPYTGQRRRFSGFENWQLTAAFRQDLGRFGWGMSYVGGLQITFFRREELDRQIGIESLLTAFAEYRPDQRTTLTFGVNNFANVGGTRSRVFFFPDRSNPSRGRFEYRERNSHVTFSLRFREWARYD